MLLVLLVGTAVGIDVDPTSPGIGRASKRTPQKY